VLQDRGVSNILLMMIPSVSSLHLYEALGSLRAFAMLPFVIPDMHSYFPMIFMNTEYVTDSILRMSL